MPLIQKVLLNCKEISDESLIRLFQAIEENVETCLRKSNNLLAGWNS